MGLHFNQAQFSASYGLFKQIPPQDRLEIAFSGRSNVGKSSLINKVLGRKSLARVSAVPGKTVTLNFYTLGNLHLVDLPGYGYAKRARSEKERWAGLIEGYLGSERDIGLVFQLIDMRHPPTNDDLMMIGFLVETQLPFVVVLTKSDKLNRTQRNERMQALMDELPYADQITVIPFSSQTGEGVEAVRDILEELSQEYENNRTEDAD